MRRPLMGLWVKPVILNPSTVTLSPSFVMLSEVKHLRVNSSKNLLSG